MVHHQAGGVIDIEYIIIRDRDHHGTRKDGQKSRGDAGHQRSLVELPQHQVKAPGNDDPKAGDDGPPVRHLALRLPSDHKRAQSDDDHIEQPEAQYGIKRDQRRYAARFLVMLQDVHMPDHKTEAGRSEEHTSELQSLMRISYAVFCLKKKKEYK